MVYNVTYADCETLRYYSVYVRANNIGEAVAEAFSYKHHLQDDELVCAYEIDPAASAANTPANEICEWKICPYRFDTNGDGHLCIRKACMAYREDKEHVTPYCLRLREEK